MIRVAHATDIHWNVMPPWSRMRGKRLLGGANLVFGRRGKRYSVDVQRALVEHILALAPDAVLLSGDLTQTSLEAEFEAARADLEPVLARLPTLVLPGNHDVYTSGARRDRRFHRYFGDVAHLGDGGVARLDVGPVTLIGLDPCRPGLLSSGLVPPEQLAELTALLADPELADRHLLLALHYPVLDRRGRLYDGVEHGLRNAAALIAVLARAPKKPVAILHGHEHHGFTVPLDLGGVTVPIFNAGTGGHVYEAARGRGAAMNVYAVDDGGRLTVERYLHDGSRFEAEAVAYASGR